MEAELVVHETCHTQLATGLQRVLVRIRDGVVQNLSVAQLLTLNCSTAAPTRFLVTALHEYATVDQLLSNEPLDDIFPSGLHYDRAREILNVDCPPHLVARFGLVAIHVALHSRSLSNSTTASITRPVTFRSDCNDDEALLCLDDDAILAQECALASEIEMRCRQIEADAGSTVATATSHSTTIAIASSTCTTTPIDIFSRDVASPIPNTCTVQSEPPRIRRVRESPPPFDTWGDDEEEDALENARHEEKRRRLEAPTPLVQPPPPLVQPPPSPAHATLVSPEILDALGVPSLYQWQLECLQVARLKGNIVYSAPTSGGKTLVAEVLLLETLLERKKNVIFILPYVSLVQEKARGLEKFAKRFDFNIEKYCGPSGRIPPPRSRERYVYLCTIEKADMVVNHLMEEGRLGELGCCVVDELHFIGMDRRGAVLESVLVKLLQCTRLLRFVGMTATVGNIEELREFFRDAGLYQATYRPVALHQFALLQKEKELFAVVQDVQLSKPCLRPLDCVSDGQRAKAPPFTVNSAIRKGGVAVVVALLREVAPVHGSLVFCWRKAQAEQLCIDIARHLCDLPADNELQQRRRKLWMDLADVASKTGDDDRSVQYVCPTLTCSIAAGVAYHHGGLTMDERTLIEAAFRAGTLCVLTCTTTLAAGVNLPATRVILRSPRKPQNAYITRSEYTQMCGRAGRAGTVPPATGESYMLLENARECSKFLSTLAKPFEDCASMLLDGKSSAELYRLILSIVGAGRCDTISSVLSFLSLSLCRLQCADQAALNLFSHGVLCAIRSLVSNGILFVSNNPAALDAACDAYISHPPHSSAAADVYLNPLQQVRLCATPLGRATYRSGIDQRYVKHSHDTLKRALDSMALSTELHLLYLVVPYADIARLDIVPHDFGGAFHKYIFSSRYVDQRATEHLAVALQLKGGDPSAFLRAQMNHSIVREDSPNYLDSNYFKAARLCTTLILHAVVTHEKPVFEAAHMFEIDRGKVQALMQNAACNSGALARFCAELTDEPGFDSMRALCEALALRLSYGCKAELVELMQLDGVRVDMARLLRNNRYGTLASLARASAEELVQRLNRPFVTVEKARGWVANARELLRQQLRMQREAAYEVELELARQLSTGAEANFV